MNIGIIGIGAIGGTIAKKPVKAGHIVKAANSRGKDAVKDFAAGFGAVPSDLAEIGEGAAKRRTCVMTHFNELTGGDCSHENVIRVNRKIKV